MLYTKDDYIEDIRENMRGGVGRVKIVHTMPKEGLHKNCRLVAEIVLEAGCSIGYHDHIGEMEIFIFHDGTGLVNDDGVEVAVKSGDTITTYNGGHGVNNTGDKPLKFTAVIILD